MTVVNDMAETATRQSPLTKTNLKVWVEGPVSTIRDFQKWLRDGFYKEMSNGAQKVAREAALHAVTRNDDDASTFVDFFDLRSDAETVTATLRQRFPALKFPSGSVAWVQHCSWNERDGKMIYEWYDRDCVCWIGVPGEFKQLDFEDC
jgi:hypothetical protein